MPKKYKKSFDIGDIDPDTAKNNEMYWSTVGEKYSRNGGEHISTNCPKCSTTNWIYIGDPEDMTFCAPEGCECFSCKHKFFVGEPWEVREMNLSSFDDHKGDFEAMVKADEAYFEEGEKVAPYNEK